MTHETTPACLYPDCEKPPKVRGLCQSHYSTALKLIKEELTTWEELVAAGKALEAKPFGNAGPRNSERRAWFLGLEMPEQ